MSFETDEKTILEPGKDSGQAPLKTEAKTTESADDSKVDSLEIAREARRQQGNRINLRKVVNRRRQPGEIPTRRITTQNFCRECMGWDSDGFGSIAANVRNCPCKECWNYPYRNGSLDPLCLLESEADNAAEN